MEDRGEAHELLVTAAIAFAHAGRFDEAGRIGEDTVALATRLGPHRMLHAGSALTSALLPPGRLVELREATAAAPSLVEDEGMHTCFHGLAALAGQALCAFEAGDGERARRALDVFDSVEVAGPLFSAAHTIDVLRPLIGAEDAARRSAANALVEGERPNVQRDIAQTRLDLQLCAVARDWPRLAELEGRARALAGSACAPFLAWISDWASACELADRGEQREAVGRALAATAALEAYGERYLGARLLVDLLPALDGEEATRVAEEAIPKLEAIGAHASAWQADSLGAQAGKIAKVWSYESSDLFSDAERAALRLAHHAALVPNAATDEDFEELHRHFDAGEIVELVTMIALFGVPGPVERQDRDRARIHAARARERRDRPGWLGTRQARLHTGADLTSAAPSRPNGSWLSLRSAAPGSP